MKRHVIKIKDRYVEQYKSGYPLVKREYLIKPYEPEPGSLIELQDKDGKFVCNAYAGTQNMGIGWVISRRHNTVLRQTYFDNKIATALNKRFKLYSQDQTTAFRVFNGEGDGIGGLVIDYFDGYYVVHWYNEGIYKYKEQILESLKKMVEYSAIYEKRRFKTNGQYIEGDDFVAGKRGKFPLIIKENNINYATYLNDGAMVGIFLDQRHVRKLIRDKYANGKKVLNTFSYTGAFSIAAALGGAVETISVDLANRSFDKTAEQFEVNGLDPSKHRIIVEDVFDFFKKAVKQDEKYDLVILDPPSYARSKKNTFSASKDYSSLLSEAIQITERNGVIVASTNASNFDMNQFKSFIDKAFRDNKVQYKILEEVAQPSDFSYSKHYPEGNYLKVVFIKRIG